ncbi:hypothetical protein [Nitrosomonas sp.]|uniref:hypothetical protein n=1 Tax=Nitrosomonas sp. TaxID=42353 RepID=UPI0032EE7B6D
MHTIGKFLLGMMGQLRSHRAFRAQCAGIDFFVALPSGAYCYDAANHALLIVAARLDRSCGNC